MRDMLTTAKQKFNALSEIGEDTRAWTWIDTEKPDFQGMVKNCLVSWWTDELSKAWAGVDTTDQTTFSTKGMMTGIKQLFQARDNGYQTAEEEMAALGIPPEQWELVKSLDGEYTREQLIEFCNSRGLRTSGTKKKLIAGLLEIGYFGDRRDYD